MPYTKKEEKLYRSLVKQYGAKKAKAVYHGMLNERKHEKNFGARSKRERAAGKKRARKRRKAHKGFRRKRRKRTVR